MDRPCGHVFACDICLKDLHRRRANCSICRGKIQSVQKIYPNVFACDRTWYMKLKQEAFDFLYLLLLWYIFF